MTVQIIASSAGACTCRSNSEGIATTATPTAFPLLLVVLGATGMAFISSIRVMISLVLYDGWVRRTKTWFRTVETEPHVVSMTN
jgi:hypothetical protein